VLERSFSLCQACLWLEAATYCLGEYSAVLLLLLMVMIIQVYVCADSSPRYNYRNSTNYIQYTQVMLEKKTIKPLKKGSDNAGI
jgi:hypothetical protein